MLAATKELPRRVAHEKRKTIGIRIPDNAVVRGLLDTLGEPLISCTLQFPDEAEPVADPQDCRDRLDREVDVVLDSGNCGLVPTTVIDLSDGETVRVVRQGKGPTHGLLGN